MNQIKIEQEQFKTQQAKVGLGQEGQDQQDWGSIRHSLEQQLSEERQKQWQWGPENDKKGITTSDQDIAKLMIEILMNPKIPSAIKTKQVEKIKEGYIDKELFYSDPNSPKRPAFFKNQQQENPYKMPNVTAPQRKPSIPGDWRTNPNL